jgi:hypothetical protein
VGLDRDVGPDHNASEELQPLDRILGVRFRDASQLETALTNRKYAFENGIAVNN